MLLVQEVPQLLVQGLYGAVYKLHPAWPVAVRLCWPAARWLLLVARRLMRRALRLRCDGPWLHGRGVRLLQHHRLVGGRLGRGFPCGAGLLVRLTCLKGGRSNCFFCWIHVERDGWHDGAARHVRHYGDGGDARLIRGEVAGSSGSRSSNRGVFSDTGLRLLDPGLVDFWLLRLHKSVSHRRGGGRGGGGWDALGG